MGATYDSVEASRRSESTWPPASLTRMHLALTPTLLGSGEALFAGIDLTKLGYHCTEYVPTASATHVVLVKG